VDLRVSRVGLHAGDRSWRGRVERHPDSEMLALRFDGLVPAGRARLELSFSGRLRSDLRGLYAVETGGHRFAFTQLAPASARRVFPCFDEPAMKARTRIAVTTAAGQRVLSNAPVASRELRGDGRQTVRFEPTPPLSSYLLALAVGRLERSAGAFAGSTEIRVWHVPGKGALCDFALEAARETLLRLESWFDLPYPYAKLDLVAVPDFEFGAMENAGAVFFRETVLLVDAERASLAELRRAAEVICHELAHMWYGDLVTMAWWDDLWLNEAFATWMAYAIVDAWQPAWRMWPAFLARRSAALDLDGLEATHSVYAPVRTPQEAEAGFDVITYEKGAAVLRMLERFLGAEVFCAGVRKYVRRHRESTATADDLWRALGEVSGVDVGRVARAWIEQPGHPVVRVRRREVDGSAVLELRQERFTERALGSRGRGGPRWPVPWMGRVGDGPGGHTHTVRHLLTRAVERVPAEGAALGFVYGNADEGAFLRPWHDDADLADLVESLGSLGVPERMGLVEHQWALVRSGRAPIAGLLDLLAAAGADPEPDVLAAARRPLAATAARLAPDAGPTVEERFRAWIEVYYGGQLDELGWEAAGGEDARTRERRAVLLDVLGRVARASSVLAEAEERCSRHLDGRERLDPELADAVVSMAALRGDARLHERYREVLREAPTPQEQRRFLLALADFEAPEAVERTLELLLGGDVATQDTAFLLARLLENRAARESTWRFVRRRWRRLRARMGPLLAHRVVAATPWLGTRAHRDEVAAFFAEHPLPAGDRVLRQALERFDAYGEYRDRAAPGLAAYLGAGPGAGAPAGTQAPPGVGKPQQIRRVR